jgi:hypothetical protein
MSEEQDFASFEAEATADPVVTAPTPETPEAPKPELELTEDEEAVDAPEDEEGGDPDPKDGQKRRSKPASQRIAELTAKLRAAERELEARAAPAEPAQEIGEPPAEPNPEDFEFGDSDPAYTKALIKHAAEVARHEAKVEAANEEKARASQREQQAWGERIQTGLAKAELEAKTRYTDFDAKIAEAVEARAGEPLPPLLSVGIGLSPAGADILYKLATDTEASARIETLAKNGNHNAFAMAFGELEGESLADTDDADLDMADPLDMARMMGRMRARLRGGGKPAAPKVSVTQAPEPPQQRARGGSGQFEVRGDTSDFAAFERAASKR